MADLNLKGYNTSLTIMDIPVRFYSNTLASFAHHDIVKGIGAYRPAMGLPTAFVGKENGLEFSIPVGKICAALPIDRTGTFPIGGGSINDKFYSTGESSGYSRGIPYEGNTLTEADSNLGAGNTLLGDMYPVPGLYVDDGTISSEGWPSHVVVKPGLGMPGYGTTDNDYNAELNIPVGVLVTHAKKWRRGTYLNNNITPTYTLIKQNRMRLPYVNFYGLLDKITDSGIWHVQDGSGEQTDVVATKLLGFMHGWWKFVAGASEPSFTGTGDEQNIAKAVFYTFRDISKWYTFYWDTNNFKPKDSKYPDFNEFMFRVKPDIYGNYTAAEIWLPLLNYGLTEIEGDYEFGINGVTELDDSDEPTTVLVNPAFYHNLAIGKVNMLTFDMPRSFLEYVDAPPGSGFGTDAGGIHPLVYDFMHDFILLLNYHWTAHEEISVDCPFTLKATDIQSYVNVDHIFGEADIFVEV